MNNRGEKPKRMTKDEIQQLRDMSWVEYDKELREAYAEIEPELSGKEEEINMETEQWQNFLNNYPNLRNNTLSELGLDSTDKKDDNVSITIQEFTIGLPNSLAKLAKEASSDIFYYIPDQLREFIVHHEYIIELMSNYFPEYIAQPDRREFEPLVYVMEYAYSLGLAFRKMFCVQGEYAAIFLTYTSRTDDTMIQDFKSNANIMLFEESIAIERKIEELEKRKRANEGILDGSITIMEDGNNNGQHNIKIEPQDTVINYQEATEYIYSSLTVLIFFELDKKSLPSIIEDKTAMIIDWNKYPNIMCKFHHMYVLPSR